MTDRSSLAEEAGRIAADERFTRAVARLEESDERTLAEQTELTEIPAPPFGEAERGARMAELLVASGVRDVETDAVGNVFGWIGPGGADAEPIVVGAHLDTVFAAETDVTVTRDEGRLSGPGIADDGRGLAALLALSRALAHGELSLSAPLLVVATVGEEGVGDLRGVRHLFGPNGAGRHARAFVSLDGAGLDRVVSRGVGSRRYRVTLVGPGGHSWADWGAPNPIHALADAVSRLNSLELAAHTTLSVGLIEGGTAVNAIAARASMQMEVRSTSEDELARLDGRVRGVLDGAARDFADTRADSDAGLSLEIDSLGSRPAGVTRDDEPLVLAAVVATEALGHRAALTASSTDANVPMAHGIPAVTMGAGGLMGRAHTLAEWYENTDGVTGIARALLTLLVFDAHAPDGDGPTP